MALGTVLPFWPALLFTYLEPVSLYVALPAQASFRVHRPVHLFEIR
jgi:hypothetical protein